MVFPFNFCRLVKKFRDKNNSSCVLKIENRVGRVLLTGDIEKKAEDYLIKTYAEELQAEVLLIPHHGSKTSSSFNFIKEVAPKYAVISYAFDNRYHFPHPQTLETLGRQKIAEYNTANCGMISIELIKGKVLEKPLCYRNL
ncbi:MAG: hypothetical protein H0U73_03285 [Tatlockia sp.]|nr:hypothetical protein [Tatlockia sp.]